MHGEISTEKYGFELSKELPKSAFGLPNVNGFLSPEDKVLNPTRIAEKFWDLYEQRGAQEMNLPA